MITLSATPHAHIVGPENARGPENSASALENAAGVSLQASLSKALRMTTVPGRSTGVFPLEASVALA